MNCEVFQGTKGSRWLRGGSDFLVCVLVMIGFCACSEKNLEEQRYFDIPEGEATSTLKEAAKQAEVEILFSSEVVERHITSPIRGKYIPSVAFARMLSDPALVVVQHEGSGVYTIKRLQVE